MDLSEQQLVDCDRQYSKGCNGGVANIAMDYARTNGLVAE